MSLGEYIKHLLESEGGFTPKTQFYIYGISQIYLIIILSIVFEGTGPLV